MHHTPLPHTQACHTHTEACHTIQWEASHITPREACHIILRGACHVIQALQVTQTQVKRWYRWEGKE